MAQATFWPPPPPTPLALSLCHRLLPWAQLLLRVFLLLRPFVLPTRSPPQLVRLSSTCLWLLALPSPQAAALSGQRTNLKGKPAKTNKEQ